MTLQAGSAVHYLLPGVAGIPLAIQLIHRLATTEHQNKPFVNQGFLLAQLITHLVNDEAGDLAQALFVVRLRAEVDDVGTEAGHAALAEGRAVGLEAIV